MKGNICLVILNFISQIDLFLVFSVLTALTVIETLTLCLLTRQNKMQNQNFVHLIFSGGLMLVLTAFALINGVGLDITAKLFFPLCYVGLCVIAFMPIKLTAKKLVIKQEQIDLAKIIDGEYRRQSVLPVEQPDVTVETKPITQTLQVATNSEIPPTSQPKGDADVDFTHVKNVIERLNYHNVSLSDKRLINELITNVALAERGETTPELKSKINDGLGFLLKIMSKYKV